MVIRYYNARILQGSDVVEGDFIVYDNMIAHIGPSVIGMKYDKEIDVKGNLIMPTFKDAHTHSPMTFLRSMADDEKLQDWLTKSVFPAEAKLNEDYCYWLTKLAILEYLQSGIGSISDMYFMLNPIVHACAESGIRNAILYGSNNAVCGTKKISRMFDEGIKKYKVGLIEYRIGIHAEYTCDLKLLQEISEYVNEKQLPIYVHMSETEKEVQECFSRYNKTPVKLFNDLGLFNYGGTIYHMVHPKNDDLKIIKEREINVVSCPASNLKLASGIAPIAEMQEMGINVALGTDGAASNNSLDMFKEMYLASTLQKIKNKDASSMKGEDVLKMATINGSKAMGNIGINGLYPNQKADFIIVDLNQPNMQPINNIAKNLVYSGNKLNVIKTVVDGKTLYENGNYFINEDVEKIYSMCNVIAKRIRSEI